MLYESATRRYHWKKAATPSDLLLLSVSLCVLWNYLRIVTVRTIYKEIDTMEKVMCVLYILSSILIVTMFVQWKVLRTFKPMLPQPLNSLQRYVGTFFALLRQQNKQIKQCVDSDSNSIYRNPGKHYQQKKSSHCQLDLNCKRTS